MGTKLEKLEVYQSSMELAKMCFKISDQLNEGRRYQLSKQLERSAISIPSNLAEGNAGRSQKVFHRYVEIAIGSAHELQTQLELAGGYADAKDIHEAQDKLQIIIRRVFALRNYLERQIEQNQ